MYQLIIIAVTNEDRSNDISKMLLKIIVFVLVSENVFAVLPPSVMENCQFRTEE